MLDRAPIADDTTAGIVAGTWAGFDPDAIVPVRVGWLAGVMERALLPTSLSRGLADAEAGRLVDLSSFAKYAEYDDEPPC